MAATGLALYRLCALAVQAWRLRRLRSRLTLLGDARAERMIDELAAQLGLHRPVYLAAAPPGASPMTFGWRRPIVALPPELLGEPSELRTVLLHELIHVRRGDHTIGWAVQLLAALFVAHPGVALLRRYIDAYRELSCDAEVLFRERLAPDRYARLLLRFGQTATPAAVSMCARLSTLKHRIKAMQHLPTTISPTAFRRLSLSVAAVLFLGPVFLAACTAPESGSDRLEAQGSYRTDDPEYLEAQVAYLRNEIKELHSVFNSPPEGESRAEMTEEREFAQRRYELLNGMLSVRMQLLEEARMEAATASWIARLDTGR